MSRLVSVRVVLGRVDSDAGAGGAGEEGGRGLNDRRTGVLKGI